MHAALVADLSMVSIAISCLQIKARRILDILDSLAARRGALELEHLRFMSDEEVKAELSQFKGVGPKTVKPLPWNSPETQLKRMIRQTPE
jgi:3-methyladenine DNA glycosylase/8-oxoguanine DNA glycosylase